MVTVAEILKQKGHNVWTISPEAKVLEALKIMAEKEIGALLVMDGPHLVGIMSERDYARKIQLMGRCSVDTPVRDIMTSNVFAVHNDTKAEECMALMTDKHIRHLPVFDKDKLVGVLSIGDIVKTIMTEQKITIDHLQDYITGKYE